MIFQERKNPVWNLLVKHYQLAPHTLCKTSYSTNMVFFKLNQFDEYDYFNSMYVGKTEIGLIIKPTLNHYFVKGIYIPWDNLKEVDRKRLFLRKITVYQVAQSNVFLAI